MSRRSRPQGHGLSQPPCRRCDDQRVVGGGRFPTYPCPVCRGKDADLTDGQVLRRLIARSDRRTLLPTIVSEREVSAIHALLGRLGLL